MNSLFGRPVILQAEFETRVEKMAAPLLAAVVQRHGVLRDCDVDGMVRCAARAVRQSALSAAEELSPVRLSLLAAWAITLADTSSISLLCRDEQGDEIAKAFMAAVDAVRPKGGAS